MSLTYPGGFYIQYNRDSIGRVVGIWNGALWPNTYYYVTGVAYGAADGAISLIDYGGGASESFSYTASGQLGYVDIRTAGVPQGRMRWYYTRDSGRITRIEEVKTSTTDYRDYFATYDYTYDRWGRLASAVRQYDDSYGNWSTDWSLSYSYDRYGNMLGRQNPTINWTQTFTVDAATNRLQSYTTVWWGNPSTVTYAYDAAGNSVTRGSRSVAWDGAGRLEQVWRASDGALYGSYRYDALGRRVKKSWNYPVSGGRQMTGSELYVYGAGGEVLVEYRSESGEWYGAQTTTSYSILLGGQAVARRVTGTCESSGPTGSIGSTAITSARWFSMPGLPTRSLSARAVRIGLPGTRRIRRPG